MDWTDWIVLILGTVVFAVTGGWIFHKIHRLKVESQEDMRKKLHGEEDSAEEH